MAKRKVLIVGEGNYLHSGFGRYIKEIMEGLYATNNYELAEFSCYARPFDPKTASKWKFYANAPSGKDKEEEKLYKKNDVNQFGLWRFDRTLLDFKPDIVYTFRDPWMDCWIADSPLRPYFYWAWMPTIDSAPIKPRWLNDYLKADALFAYSEFGIKALQKQVGDISKVIGCASPGVDHNVFKPVMNKKEHRQTLGISPDTYIVGTIMRNQKRKLFPDLMEAFRKFLDTAPQHIANKTYLYIHTSYPEKHGWDIPTLILESGISNRVLCSYICKQCGNLFASFFQDARTICRRCGQISATLPNVATGATIEDLVKVFNTFDVYVQYAICEGLGIPAIEAAACGVPVMAVDWTAMADVSRNTNGYQINVERVFRELETGADRCYPDNNHLVEQLIKFFAMPDAMRRKKGAMARKGCIDRYNWKKTVEVLDKHFSEAELTGKQGQWDSPPNIFQPNFDVPKNLNNKQLVEWVMTYIMNEANQVHGLKGMLITRDLNFGATFAPGHMANFSPDQFIKQAKTVINNKNQMEQARCGMLPLTQPDFIQWANRPQ